MTSKRGVNGPPHPISSEVEDCASSPEAQDSAYVYHFTEDMFDNIPLPNNKIDNFVGGTIISSTVAHEVATNKTSAASLSNANQIELGRPPYLATRASSAPKQRTTSSYI